MKIYCDLDGVLADLDAHYSNLFGLPASKELDNVDWRLVRDSKGFFASVPLMPDATELWSYIARYNPIILTGIPKRVKVEEASDNKREWVARHFGETIEVRCVHSGDKHLSAMPGDILIDDWEKYKDRWIVKGGIWITHVSASNTIEILRQMGL